MGGDIVRLLNNTVNPALRLSLGWTACPRRLVVAAGTTAVVKLWSERKVKWKRKKTMRHWETTWETSASTAEKATRIATVSIDVHWSDLDGMAFDGDVIDDLATMPLCDDCSPETVFRATPYYYVDLMKTCSECRGTLMARTDVYFQNNNERWYTQRTGSAWLVTDSMCWSWGPMVEPPEIIRSSSPRFWDAAAHFLRVMDEEHCEECVEDDGEVNETSPTIEGENHEETYN